MPQPGLEADGRLFQWEQETILTDPFKFNLGVSAYGSLSIEPERKERHVIIFFFQLHKQKLSVRC